MFNPVIASKNIKDEFINYISTQFSFANENLRKQFIKGLESIVANGPWLEINDVFKSGKSINQLIDDGVLSPLFRELESKKPKDDLHKVCLPIERPLYYHQEKAIRSIVNGANVIVSTGTGSGKTNCFLIPVLNDLLREKEKGTLNPGVRALFIYPMNALANDQMKNIRKILMCYPDITFGVYNGTTEYNEEDALEVYEAMFASEPIPELRSKLANEILSRNEMKKNPPNILFTNYAMLEHLLFRPKDDVLFSRADFKFVVLDEAHIYTGATGIETSMLLRRLRARITSSRETQFILTSATLGNNESSNADAIRFAENLCGVKFDIDNIIRSSRIKYTPSESPKDYQLSMYRELADESNYVSDVMAKYNVPCSSDDENEAIYDFLAESELYQLFRENVDAVSTIDDISDMLELDIDDTIKFISLCTRARKKGKLLIDARYHFFIRSLEGCYLSLSPDSKIFLNRQRKYEYDKEQYAVFEIALCDECGKFAFVGKIKDNHLCQISKLGESVDYFYLGSEENDEIEDDEDNKKEEYLLCPHCGAVVPYELKKNKPCDCSQDDYIRIIKANELEIGARCGNCHIGTYKRLYLGNDASTAVLATALYEELPEIKYVFEKERTESDSLFDSFLSESKKKEQKVGCQFLAFSDSRQEAAKFACYLSKSYQEFLRRRGISFIIREQKDLISTTKFTISDFVKKLTAYYSSTRSFAESNHDTSNLTVESNRHAWIAMLNELARYRANTSLTSLGILQFSYLGNSEELVNRIANNYHVSSGAVSNLLDILVFEIVKMGAICSDNDTDINDDDRKYIFYSSIQQVVKKNKAPNDQSYVNSWMPKQKATGDKKYYKNSRLYYVINYLGISEENAVKFLELYFDYLTNPKNPYCMIDKNKDKSYVLPAKYFRVKISSNDNTKWYKCDKCGKVSQFSLNGHCTVMRCDGTVSEINSTKLSSDNHFATLYLSERMSPLFIKEHTAQLSKKESATYQEEFIKKDINALSCSTTFEMGVDVGDLETVFLRDVPPLPSNYAQRAGRAGRSINAAAYCLTFAKLSSHDLSFFREPLKMIKGTILPPLFKIDNEKIVRRHIYAIALSMFFSDHSELYNGNDAELVINQKKYVEFIDWLNTKPDRLKDMIKRSIPNVNNLYDRLGIEDYTWLDNFIGDEGRFTILIREYENNIKQFEAIIKEYKHENKLQEAGKCQSKLINYKNNRLIDFLARGNILPRYGFPVDTVELYQNTTASNIQKLRLSRDLQMAIAEYAPSSEVIADGRMYTSRYIRKSNLGKKNQEWYTAYLGVCPNVDCQTLNYSETPIPSKGRKCSACGTLIKPEDFNESIDPRSGFLTERTDKDVPLSRQEKNYRSEDCYIGNKESKVINSYNFQINNIIITLESTTNDSLLVKSYNNFYVCPKCGFAYAQDESIPKDKKATQKMRNGDFQVTTTSKHESSFSFGECDCQTLHKYSLHHAFNTDVAKISFNCDTSNYNKMVSVMYAILYAISDELNIERKDIKACLSKKVIDRAVNYSIIIYDAVPGGAGHSRRLVTEDGLMLKHIIDAAYERMNRCNCDPSCYNCLRSYDNQKIHDDLDRRLAMEFLEQLLGDIERIQIKEDFK